MKTAVRALTVALGLLFAASAFAEAPPPVVKASTPAVAVSKAAAAPAAKTSAAEAPKKAAVETAPGGGNGKVWVNHKSKVYHCEGMEHYGKTKDGEYMTEADAKSKGNKSNGGKGCAVKAAKEVKEVKETKEVKAAK
jgi:hypothetical protein